MSISGRLRSTLSTLFGRSRRQSDLDDEIRFHLESAVERYRERGLSEVEAQRAARLEFGGVDSAKEGVRSAWAGARVPQVCGDICLAFRGFVRRPAYSVSVVLTVALAIGVAGGVFSALWAVVYRPLPFSADRTLMVLQWRAPRAAVNEGPSPIELAEFRTANRNIEGIAEYHHMLFTLLGHGEPRRVHVGVVSANFFSLLGVVPVQGRDFVGEDEGSSSRPVLLLSYRFWKDTLGGGNWVGASFVMNDKIHTVVGVLPPLPPAPNDNDVFMPVSACPFRMAPQWAGDRTSRGLLAVARLRAASSVETALNEVQLVADRMAKAYPSAYPKTLGLRPQLNPLRGLLIEAATPTLWLLAAAGIAIVLLVAANLINLTLALLYRRDGEIAVRAALGAGPWRIIRQLSIESGVLALTGGAVGLLLSFGMQKLLASFLGRLTPRASEIHADWSTAAVTVGLALLIGLTIGVLPALRRSKSLVVAMRCAGGGATPSAKGNRLRDLLVVLQVGGSFVLLISSGLLLRSLWNLEGVATGFRHSEVLTVHLPVNWTKYKDEVKRLAYGERLLDQVRRLPGVESAALADNYPLNDNDPWTRSVQIGRRPPDGSDLEHTADFRTVSTDYFATVGVPLLNGRPLRANDRDPNHAVALVNKAFARRFFGDRSPLGQWVTFSGGTTSWEIVGVVGDVHQRSLVEDAKPEVYTPLALRGGAADVLLVRAADAHSLLRVLRTAIHEVDPGQPIAEMRTLGETRTDSLAAPRTMALLLGAAALLALTIALTGLAGLLAYSLGLRHQEFVIRQALGANRADIARLVFARTSTLVGIGVLVGVFASLLAARGLGALLFGLGSTDPETYLVVALLLAGAAVAASLPALRRATAAQPSESLKAF
jgi:predicted permease